MLSEASSTRSSPIRSSRSCHDSANPCRAWARSPTMVKLRDGQRSSSICHSASVSSCASSTTMCANGPASRSGSAAGSPASSTRAPCRSWTRSIDISVHLGVVGLDEVVDDLGHLLPFGREGGVAPAPAPRRLRVAEPLPGRVEQRQVGDRPGLGSSRCSARTSSTASQGAHRRRYAGTDHRSPTRSVASSSGHARCEGGEQLRGSGPATAGSGSGRDLLVARACRPGS